MSNIQALVDALKSYNNAMATAAKEWIPTREMNDAFGKAILALDDYHKSQKEETDIVDAILRWLKSDDVFITDGENGEVLPNAWIDCKKESLSKFLKDLEPDVQPTNEPSLATLHSSSPNSIEQLKLMPYDEQEIAFDAIIEVIETSSHLQSRHLLRKLMLNHGDVAGSQTNSIDKK